MRVRPSGVIFMTSLYTERVLNLVLTAKTEGAKSLMLTTLLIIAESTAGIPINVYSEKFGLKTRHHIDALTVVASFSRGGGLITV
jgi:hypothetical protein